jgi:DNA polymerase-4
VRAPGLFRLSIAHVDCDAFFASIEKRDNPALRDRPVVVGGDERGVVAAACYVARTYGIRSAMPMRTARRLCPHLVVIPPNREKYAAESARIRRLMERLTPLVEAVSIDEAFLDLSGTARLHGAPPAVMLARLARQVEAETGLTISIGLSFNKFLAKMASDLDKPRGYAVIAPETATAFLDRLKVRDLWGVGPAAARALKMHGIETVPQLRARSREWLTARFGRLGAHLHDLARGHDPRPVTPEHPTRSISAETTFARDITDPRQLEAALWKLCRRVMRRALEKGLAGYVVTAKLRHADFETHTARARLSEPALLAPRLYAAARPLLRRLHAGRPVRLVGVGIAELVPVTPEQLATSLDARAARGARAELAAEALRRRFGDDIIDRGIALAPAAPGRPGGQNARCGKRPASTPRKGPRNTENP